MKTLEFKDDSAHYKLQVEIGLNNVGTSQGPLTGPSRYTAIWQKSSSSNLITFPWVARHGMTSSQYQAEFNKLTRQGYRLTHVSGYGSGRQARYAAVWEKRSGPAWVARHGMTSSQYQAEFNKLTRQGYRLTHVSGYGL